jgi:hypothetical protein
LRSAASRATGDPALRLYRFGDYGDLVGRPAAPLVVNRDRRPVASIENPGAFADVQPDAADVPWAFVQGRAGVRAGSWIAVVVNGRIAGVGRTSRGDSTDGTEFGALVPPSLVRRGHNDVELFLVTGPPTAPQLHPTRRPS